VAMDDWFQGGDLRSSIRLTLKALSRRSDARGLLQLGSQLGALLLTGAGIAATWDRLASGLLHPMAFSSTASMPAA